MHGQRDPQARKERPADMYEATRPDCTGPDMFGHVGGLGVPRPGPLGRTSVCRLQFGRLETDMRASDQPP